jgi:hypothetical protein
MQAMALDLYVHQMAGIDRDAIRETYDVPDDFAPMAALAVGYLGDPSRIPEKFHTGERSTRTRRPLDETVFGDSWGDTADLIE